MLTPKQINSLQIFSPIPLAAVLFCWWYPWPCRSFLVWCSPICLFLLLVSNLKIYSQDGFPAYCLCFLLGVLSFLTLKSLFGYFCVWWREQSSFILACGCPVFLTFINETALSPLCILESSVINYLIMYAWFTSGLSILFLSSVSNANTTLVLITLAVGNQGARCFHLCCSF